MNEPLRSVSDAAGAADAPIRAAAPLPAIEVENLSASYRVHLDTGWRAGLMDLLSRSGNSDRIIPALREITFDVPKGTVLGVIGRNGAGKSTLLRAISGVVQPEVGRITVRGRISNLAMGAGFNEGLTGRANIRLGGLAIGLDEARLHDISDEIADFAQLGEYLDLPVSAYSSGMRMRLAFAIAVHLDPEVLLIDEALVGGDTKFVAQTGWKLHELCGGGRTVVLVTHGLSTVRSMATSAIWMHEGRIVERGDSDEVVSKYMRYCRLESADLEWDQD
jgi:ABC-type polysaccharide/polyol phosphate transport system ATPase subunit